MSGIGLYSQMLCQLSYGEPEGMAPWPASAVHIASIDWLEPHDTRPRPPSHPGRVQTGPAPPGAQALLGTCGGVLSPAAFHTPQPTAPRPLLSAPDPVWAGQQCRLHLGPCFRVASRRAGAAPARARELGPARPQ